MTSKPEKCPNKASLYLPRLSALSQLLPYFIISASVWFFSCISSACKLPADSWNILYTKKFPWHTAIVCFFPPKNCEGNSLLRIPDLTMESFADFVPFQRSLHLEVQPCWIVAVTGIWTVTFLAVAIPGAEQFISSLPNMRWESKAFGNMPYTYLHQTPDLNFH